MPRHPPFSDRPAGYAFRLRPCGLALTSPRLRFAPAGKPAPSPTPHARRSLRGFTQRQCQRHDGSLAAAHPLDVAAELSRKGIDQAAAEPGIRASWIGPLAVVRDHQEKLSRKALQRHSDCAFWLAGEGIFDGIRYEFVDNEPERDRAIDRQRLARDVGFERDGGAFLFLHRLDQIATQCLQIARRIDRLDRIGFSQHGIEAPEGGDAMRHSLKRRLALAALLVARFQADHGTNNLQTVFDPVGQLLQQHADTLASDRMLALKPHALGDVFDRQQDQLYLVAKPINFARVEAHDALADWPEELFDFEILECSFARNDGLERAAELGNVPLFVAELIELSPDRMFWHD